EGVAHQAGGHVAHTECRTAASRGFVAVAHGSGGRERRGIASAECDGAIAAGGVALPERSTLVARHLIGIPERGTRATFDRIAPAECTAGIATDRVAGAEGVRSAVRKNLVPPTECAALVAGRDIVVAERTGLIAAGVVYVAVGAGVIVAGAVADAVLRAEGAIQRGVLDPLARLVGPACRPIVGRVDGGEVQGECQPECQRGRQQQRIGLHVHVLVDCRPERRPITGPGTSGPSIHEKGRRELTGPRAAPGSSPWRGARGTGTTAPCERTPAARLPTQKPSPSPPFHAPGAATASTDASSDGPRFPV